MKAVYLLFFSTAIYVVNSYSICGLVQDEWNAFKLKYKKNYGTFLEEEIRKQIFFDNWLKILKHNDKYEKGLVLFSLAMNQFGDMTSYEFVQKMNGFKKTSQTEKSALSQLDELEQLEGATFIEPANVVLPDQVDWRTQGAVTPIKNQENCGSCWAFSATGALEGQHFRHNGTLISLSEQNLVDCSGEYGNDGCDGGLMTNAFIYVKYNKGLDTEKYYPYDARDESCKYNPRNRGAVDAGFVKIPQFDEQKLQAAVATVGPISVAIDADSDEFQFYKSGVFYNPGCSTSELDHGVLAVGYGIDNKTSKLYWLVKNSWGTDWGEKGYIRMSRNRHNNCGIASMASYPLVK